MNQYQVTSVCLSRDDQQVMSGGIDNDIKVFDVRKLDIAYTMTGHKDTITGTCAVAQLCVCSHIRGISRKYVKGDAHSFLAIMV